MNVVVIGANGQLGSDVCEAFEPKHAVLKLEHADADIADAAGITAALTRLEPDCVINTAALHNVEACEADPVKSHAVNALGARNLALACKGLDAMLVHIGTDYVFNGAKAAPYVETDAPLPLNVYGNTKLAGEHYALSTWEKTCVVRVGGIYGVRPCRAKGGLNFVQLMLKLGTERPVVRVVDDEIVTPTPTSAIAAQLLPLVEGGHYGLFHATCQGACSWHAFAARIFELAGLPATLQKAAPGEFPAKVPRPLYSVLENARLKALGLDSMPDWEAGLQTYVREIGAIGSPPHSGTPASTVVP